LSEIKSFAELLNSVNPSSSESFQPLPNDSICPDCGRILQGRADVDWIIAQRPRITIVPRCHCAQQLAEAQDRLHRMANLPKSVRGPDGPRDWREASIANTRTTSGNVEAVHLVKAFALGNAPPIVVLSGPPGTGKTHMLEAVGRVFVAQQKSVRYALVASMLDSMRPSSEGSPEADVAEYMLPHLLILDDLGAEKASDWVVDKLMAIIDERYRNNRNLMIATNATEIEMIQRLGSRLADRLYDVNSGKVAHAHIDDLSARQSPMFAPVEEEEYGDTAEH
jgi:DNA replication protein DnaC